MTLAKIIDTLKMIALKHPNVNSAYEGNIYDILNAKPDNRYASVVITQQSHTTDEIYDHYGFVIFYVDRLVDDLEENRVQIQSIGKSMLGNIITAFCNEFEAECENISYQPFTQRFADETAGVYCTITIDTVKDVYCAERYWDESWSAPIVSIKNVDMSITITENGHYVLEYDPTTHTGIGKVDIDVDFNTEPYYNDGYGKGYNDGVSEQKSKLETISIKENGVYSNEDGYNHIEVNVPDLNGSYDEGYSDGINEQKSKLESINITENGTYSREDGYNTITVEVPDLNGSYEEGYQQGYVEGEQVSYNTGYEQGQTDIAANARVLNVTENGTYLSKFSDPIMPTLVTGVYSDGTEFYNYTELNDAIYNTKIAGSIDSRLEFWYKGDNRKTGDAYNLIIGSGNKDSSDCFQVRYLGTSNTSLWIEVGSSRITVNSWDDTVWHHLIISKAEGLWIDGEKKGDFSASNAINGEFFINGIGYDVNGDRRANGTFGMIKIDNVVIIPTADGFRNVNTGELLEIVQDGVYLFTNNEPKYGEGELYKTINVDIFPKVNIANESIRFGNSTFSSIPKWADWEGITDMSNMFSNCGNLKTIPLIDTSNVKTFAYAFNNSGINEIPLLNTSNSINFEYCFCGTKITELPQLDLSKGTNFYEFCYNCYNLKYVPNLDLSSATNISGLLENCNSLISVGEIKVPSVRGSVTYFLGSSTKNNFTDFGGLIGFRGSITTNGFHTCPNLSYQSCINILNGLYDFVGNGEVAASNEGKLKVHQNFIDLVGDEISIATDKGWTITA